MPFKTILYQTALRRQWDDAVKQMRNSTFLFLRSYMDYHRDRFEDASLMFTDQRNRVVALLPANLDRCNRQAVSHGGLTYGGLLTHPELSLTAIGEIMQQACDTYTAMGMQRLVWKPVPHIYTTRPAEEQLYWLFRLNGQLTARGASQAIDLSRSDMGFSTLRRRKVRKAAQVPCTYGQWKEHLPAFWNILNDNLQRLHHVKPVHTLDEIRMLMEAHPDHIRFHAACTGQELLAGCVVYECGQVAHAQYISASGKGRSLCALDGLFQSVIDHYRQQGFRYFDFGISTEKQGSILNEGLTFQKEGFGGRTICYDTYTIPLIPHHDSLS